MGRRRTGARRLELRSVSLVHRGNSYWVTATFTGDEFLPRIVEHSEPGEPARSVTPSDACVAPQLPTAGSATP